ncbi:hypothetical protein PY257_11505 [Ramlibacter sp. H39-3-26]|uniref:hypothetical protein n=1 Tax=Curvibacter soli TaxID=3031331 RepID=UPI0023DAB946|nr:hypothetical protein [Ramlibacter sp. H39-3-26]MDF1485797.1 hypothetical protein [Ramlibacter sp. H39-3-26]
MPSTSSQLLDHALAAVDRQITDLSAALIAAEPERVESQSVQLRQASAELAQVLGSLSSDDFSRPALRARLQQMAAQLAQQREGAMRIAAFAQRQAACLLPAVAQAQVSTYGRAVGK